MEKLRVVYLAPENSGVAWYRFYQPLKDLEERGIIELQGCGFDFTHKTLDLPTTKQVRDFSVWGDVFIFGRRDTKDWQRMIETVKNFSGKPVLLDIDDNIFAISPYLQARGAYHPDGEFIKNHKETAKLVDGIIVSTPALQEIYKEYNKTWIVPNGIKYVYDKIPHQTVNIGYMCSASHLENAQLVEGAIIRVLEKNPNVKFYFTKAFGGFMEGVPEHIKDRINYVPFFPLDNYLSYVRNLGLDIGIAPLMDNDFNKCKSNIRILEYWQNQMAVVASPVGEYVKTITDGYDGFLTNDWEDVLNDLVRSKEKRDYVVKNSRETLQKYDVSNFSNKYYEILQSIVNV